MTLCSGASESHTVIILYYSGSGIGVQILDLGSCVLPTVGVSVLGIPICNFLVGPVKHNKCTLIISSPPFLLDLFIVVLSL